jgi:hypothetical protein
MHPQGSRGTVTGLADIGFTLLLWRPQGPQGCLEKPNYPLSSNLVVWCAKMGPKTKKIWKTSEMTRKTSKNHRFLTLFWSVLVLDPILVHQTTKFEFSGQFCFSRHPWGSWGRQSSGVICIWKIFQLFFGCWRHLAKIFVFFKLKPDVPFIILHA